MYIQEINITSIRSIEHFQMTFSQYAGWHVLIGDNGAGKSTIIRAVALAMLDFVDVSAARLDWNDWLQTGQRTGTIDVRVAPDGRYESNGAVIQNRITLEGDVILNDNNDIIVTDSQASLLEMIFRSRKVYDKNLADYPTTTTRIPTGIAPPPTPTPPASAPSQRQVWFSVAYGPFRRFTGGNAEKDSLFKTNPHLGAHLSAFGEDVALTEALTYLEELSYKKIVDMFNDRPTDPTFDDIIRFVNRAQLLPHGATLDTVRLTDGVWFRDGNGYLVKAIHLSDGYRSVLSLTFELIRQLIRSYGTDLVFANVRNGGTTIDVPGVVLIDEIDAHLHPTWQTRIGQWFTDHFPNLQFIVTTHSPLICRACERGSIWRLAAPGSNEQTGEITGSVRDRLIYGNVLDAYGTGVFGDGVTQSEAWQNLAEQLALLNKKSIKGTITETERQRLYDLRAKMPTVE